MEEKKCYACGRLKSLKSFYKLQKSKDGHMARCKICTNSYNVNQRKKKKVVDELEKYSGHNLKFGIPKKEDYCFMYMIMDRLNYDIHSDISLQFCERYGLTYQPRQNPKDFNKFHPKDCE